jgi:hypothetical protein
MRYTSIFRNKKVDSNLEPRRFLHIWFFLKGFAEFNPSVGVRLTPRIGRPKDLV